MKHYIFTSQLIGLLFLTTIISCNKIELTREEAANMLKSQLQLPKNEIKTILLRDETGSFNMTRGFLEDLQRRGLVNLGETDNGYPYATITDEGKQYVKSEKHGTGNPYETGIDVLVATLDFGEVTGIVVNKETKTAQVDYTLIRKVTPFGLARQFQLEESPSSETKMFRMYDDGWRIE